MDVLQNLVFLIIDWILKKGQFLWTWPTSSRCNTMMNKIMVVATSNRNLYFSLHVENANLAELDLRQKGALEWCFLPPNY
jgi:hypothetical protein